MKLALYIALGMFGVVYLIVWAPAILRAAGISRMPRPLDFLIGFVTLFFDTLGIGCFATISSSYKLWNLVPDEQIPGTMNVGITIPAIIEGFIYIAVVDVDITTLVLMIGASVVGAWFGASAVSQWPRRKIQIAMGSVLLVTALFGLLTQLHLLPSGGEVLGLEGTKLLIAVVANAVLGALMTVGIGFFGPCMMVVYLMGMNPKAAFPIMMGSVAFLGPAASIPFIRRGSYNLRSALGLTMAGIPGVLLAAFLVKSLPLFAIRWLVIVVVTYTAVMMLRSAYIERTRLNTVLEPGVTS
jgi:uncharacterized membrane protein YfcA